MVTRILLPIFQAASVEEHDKSDESPASTPAESNDSTAEILFNPNVFTEYKLAGSPEVSLISNNYPLFILLLLHLKKIVLFNVLRRLKQMKLWLKRLVRIC